MMALIRLVNLRDQGALHFAKAGKPDRSQPEGYRATGVSSANTTSGAKLIECWTPKNSRKRGDLAGIKLATH